MIPKVFGSKAWIVWSLIVMIVVASVAIAIFIIDASANGLEVSTTKETMAIVLVVCMVYVVASPCLAYGARRRLRTTS